MTFAYSEAQIQLIEALRDVGDIPGAYRLAADFAEGGEGVDLACIVWLRGAADVNEGVGSYSDFIRQYTEQQYIARYGDDTGFDAAAMIQQASDDIAGRVLGHIINFKVVPPIDVIAKEDAEPAAEEIFGGDAGGWAGNPLFLFLGHQTPLDKNVLEPDGDTYDAVAMLKFLGSTGDLVTNITNAYSTML